jgi:hypothetical protein
MIREPAPQDFFSVGILPVFEINFCLCEMACRFILGSNCLAGADPLPLPGDQGQQQSAGNRRYAGETQ